MHVPGLIITISYQGRRRKGDRACKIYTSCLNYDSNVKNLILYTVCLFVCIMYDYVQSSV